MNPLEQHEIFEMEVLERLKSSRILEQLIFGGVQCFVCVTNYPGIRSTWTSGNLKTWTMNNF